MPCLLACFSPSASPLPDPLLFVPSPTPYLTVTCPVALRFLHLQQTLYEHANALEDRQRMINLMCEQLYFKLHNNLG